MLTRKTMLGAGILLAVLSFVVMLGSNPVDAFLAPTETVKAQAPVVVATATITPTKVVASTATTAPVVTPTKTVAVSTATATKLATLPPATATVTVSVATATKPSASVTPVVTATKTVTPVIATPTKVPPSPTATKVLPSPTPTRVAVKAPSPRAGVVSALSTMFVVQNTDPSVTATITATFYNTSGSPVGSGTSQSVNSNRAVMIDQRTDSSLGTTFQGSVVMGSNTALVAIVNEYAGSAATLGSDFRADSYNGVASTQVATSALLPQVLKNVTDSAQNKTYNSTIAIQNASLTASALVTITYTNIWAVAPTPTQQVHSGISILPGSAVYLDMQNEASAWTSSFGPASLTASQSVAVIVNQNAAGSLLIYRGFTPADGGNSLLVTQALTSIFDSGQQLNYGSAIEGMTVDGSSTTVTVNYTNLLGTNRTCTLPAGSTFRIDLRPGQWPASCSPPVNGSGQFFGSVRLTAGGTTSIVALSNLQSDYSATKGIRSSTSRAFVTTTGLSTGYAPLVMNGYLDSGTGVTWGTALEGRFLTGGGVVSITYYPIPSGTPLTDSYTAGSDQIFRFDQRAVNPQTNFTLPTGAYSAVLTSTGGSFVFTVNSQGASSTLGDALTVYMSQ